MSGAPPPPARRIDWGAMGLFALGLLSAGLAVAGLSPTVAGLAGGASVVELRPFYLVAVPLAVSLFALAAIALIPRAQGVAGRAGREKDAAFWRAATRLFYAAGAGLLVAIVIAPAGQAALGATLAAKGYERCPPSATDAVRRPPLRWHRPDAPCP